MNEHSYIRSVNRHIKPEIYRWKISDRYTAGIPDCWYRGDRGSLWAEYKFIKTIPPTVTPALTALQSKWLSDRQAQGEEVIVILGSPAGGVLFHNKDQWMKGLSRSAFQVLAMPPKEIATWINLHCAEKG